MVILHGIICDKEKWALQGRRKETHTDDHFDFQSKTLCNLFYLIPPSPFPIPIISLQLLLQISASGKSCTQERFLWGWSSCSSLDCPIAPLHLVAWIPSAHPPYYSTWWPQNGKWKQNVPIAYGNFTCPRSEQLSDLFSNPLWGIVLISPFFWMSLKLQNTM